jgi:aminoglycoside phosphotransferase family enzyme
MLDQAAADTLRDLQHACLEAQREVLEARATRGCVVEAHGDLRPEHILVDAPPAVIDCLEFDRNLRIQDRAEELAFLELECARLGRPDIGRRVAADCLAQLGDAVPAALALFHRSHRAATRAKLYVWRAGEPDGGSPEQWHGTAREYLATALAAAREAASGVSR